MRRLTPWLLALLLALAPALADARPGLGGSFGSRGSRTYSAPASNGLSNGAAPIQRSYTPNSGSGSAYGSGYGNSGYGNGYGGFGQRARSPFTAGLLGGFLGAGIGGLLFGRGFFGGLNGGGSLIGLLLQLFLLYLLASWAYRRFFAGNLAVAGGGRFARMMNPGPARPTNGPARSGNLFGGSTRATKPVALVQGDYQSFDQLLHGIQKAWSAQDLAGMHTLATPEMVSFFSEQLSELASRGVRNTVTDVRLQQGDLSEAWSEGAREYATVSMRFSMIDVTRDATGRVVDGSPNERVTVTEVWTFLRAPGVRWVLSAIQQSR